MSSFIPSKYKAVQVTSKGKLQMNELSMPEVKDDNVLIKVEACGVCHSDSFTVEAAFPGVEFPRVPGHEVIGVIVKTGDKVSDEFKVGQRVGRGWHGYHCFTCDHCRAGDFVTCLKEKVTGIHVDGGYAEYMIAPENALAKVPDGLKPEDAASLMCAGVTVFNGLRNLKVPPPATVVVHGVGGLGHLAIQFARKMGYKVVAVSRGKDKEADAKALGAHEYYDTDKGDAVATIKKAGGAAVVIATVPGKVVSPFVDCLAPNGAIIAIGADQSTFDINSMQLITWNRKIQGHASGTAFDSEHTLNFAKLNDVQAKIEVYPFEKFQEAYDQMMKGKPKFRVILKIA